jgi:hypothetical protein
VIGVSSFCVTQHSRCLLSPHLRTETDSVSEMSCFLVIYISGRWTKSTYPAILSAAFVSAATPSNVCRLFPEGSRFYSQ